MAWRGNALTQAQPRACELASSYYNAGIALQRLSGKELDRRAEEILREYCPERLDTAGITPIARIGQELSEKGELRLAFDAPLSAVAGGDESELGRFMLDPPTILIDASLTGDDHRFNFTLAHELAHFFLHSNLEGIENLVDTEKDLRFSSEHPSTPEEWIEWQANRFGGAMLMPAKPFRQAVVEVQLKLGILSNLGHVYVESKRYSLTDFNAVRKRLSEVFDVSSAAVESRLRTLRWLIDTRRH